MSRQNHKTPLKLISCCFVIFFVLLSVSWFISNPNIAHAAPVETTTAGPSITIDAATNQHAISPYIYGLNFAKEAFATEINLPLRRWGGNATSRYNWQSGNTNAAMDWYFENMSQTNDYTGATETHTQWVDQNVRTGTQSLITIPLVGYVAKDSTSCGFSITKYGAQQDKDVWRTDCGNGVKTNNSNLTGVNPTDTSVASNPAFMQSWVASLVTKYGAASSSGVKFYAMDNEPDLWGETHRDIHPAMQSYDELYSKMVAYATAVKTADPTAKVLGYSSFGWTGYWYSELDSDTAAKNGYTQFPDYQTHGNLYQVPWLLTQMNSHDTSTGTRLLDYLDLHYYPSGGNALTTAGDANMQALRLRSTRSLWDPTYVDESWIGGSDQPVDWRTVRLIPRMHAWVDTYYPGTKLAVTEYNFGGLESINGALTQADVLGIFGREDLDMANLWNYPNTSDGLGYDHFETEPGAYAFRMFRNYDGSGGKYGDISLSASSADQAKMAVYAARRTSDGALTLMFVNKTASTLTSSVALTNFQPASAAQVYNYSSANLTAIIRKADQAVTASGFTADFPANSITLVVIPLASVPNLGGCAIFPADNIWNTAINSLPVNSRSDQWLTSIGKTTGFHMDFGSGLWDGGPIGIPYNIVPAGVPKYTVSFYYPDESDPGPYPIGSNPNIEYGSDHHLLTVDSSNCNLYEIYDASTSGSAWSGGSGAIWNLASNALRPDGWTSADAAGLPILPGLVRYDEIISGHINHAIRFTASSTNGYIWPARHLTSNNSSTPQIPPMGARFRLKSTYDISSFSAVNQVILQAMKTYGIILADNGSNWYISGAPDERWNNDDLHLLSALKGSDFEAVDSTSLIMDPNSGAVWKPAYTISGSAGVAGATLSYTDGQSRTATADSSGSYSLGVSNNWSGTVTPSKTGYSFSPISKTYSNVAANQTAQNYISSGGTIPPTVLSIVRANTNPSAASKVDFTVTFSKAVTGVDSTDFNPTLTGLSGASVTNVSGSGSVYTVTTSIGPGAGTLRLDLIDNDTIQDLSGTPLGGTGTGNGNFSSGEIYTIYTPTGDITIGGVDQGTFSLLRYILITKNTAGLVNGPVKVTSSDGSPFFTSQRATSGESYNEVMGLPTSQLTTDYWFPAYDHSFISGTNADPMRMWVLVGNASATQAATVNIYIAGVLQTGSPFSIPAGGRITPRWIGVKGGPVEVVSTNGVKIFTSERAFTYPTNSFNEILGYPANQLTTEYWFPYYDSTSMSNSIQVGNTSLTQAATVDIYIGADKKGSYSIPVHGYITQNYPNVVDGPVRVVSTNGVSVVASQITLSGLNNSFNEVMGFPYNQFTTEYWFPSYDHSYNPGINTNLMRMWVLVGNPSTTQSAIVNIYIGGVLQTGSPFPIPAGGRVTPRWVGVTNGPVRVVSTNGVNIFTSERVLTYPNSVFNEIMGFPLNQMASEYWFPYYDSVSMSNDVLVGRP